AGALLWCASSVRAAENATEVITPAEQQEANNPGGNRPTPLPIPKKSDSDDKTDPGPRQTAPANPGEKRESDPFSPSPSLRARAQPNAEGENGDAALGPPRLLGLVATAETAVACFRWGEAVLVVSKGEAFAAGEARYTFAEYRAPDTIILTDAEGKKLEMRIGGQE
ncbi:MAG: hypothetical protein N3A66_07735, partial [Planctomycetota bacterium]|nr:hypothetical protein [Planctomycetota bacterium]